MTYLRTNIQYTASIKNHKGGFEFSTACFVDGRCLEGHHVDGKTAKNEIACLELCHGNPDCQWFSFSVDYKFCDLLGDCGQLDESRLHCIVIPMN